MVILEVRMSRPQGAGYVYGQSQAGLVPGRGAAEKVDAERISQRRRSLTVNTGAGMSEGKTIVGTWPWVLFGVHGVQSELWATWTTALNVC